jgi:hypothetical protein
VTTPAKLAAGGHAVKRPEPLGTLLDALEALGWVVDLCEPVSTSGGKNPTRVDLRQSQDRRQLLVYSWFVTGEGKGRKGTDYRIQTTRAHDGPLMFEPGRITVGLGWDRERQVFAVFDGWTKRETGRSSSVHIARALLDAAAEQGWAMGGPRWDARVAFTEAEAGRFLIWIGGMTARREAVIDALKIKLHDRNAAEIVGDTWRDAIPWLRVGDRMILADANGTLADDSLWRIEDLTAKAAQAPSGNYNRTHIHFSCRRVGIVRDPDIAARLA